MYSKQHKRKKLLTSISTIALTTILAFTSIPLTNVYATEKTNPTSKTEKDTVLGDRADNGGQGSSSTDKYIDADDSWQPVPGFDISHSGYRMYIINEDLQRISPIYDFYFQKPEKVIKSFYTTRFDEGMDEAYKNMHTTSDISQLEQWCTNDLTTKSWTDVPKPVIGAGGTQGHDSNGTTFKEWFLAGNPNLGTVTEKAYDTIINSSTGNGSTTTQENKTGTSDKSTEPEYKEVVPMTYLNIGNKIVDNTYEVEENPLDKYFGHYEKDAMELLCGSYRSTYIAKVRKYYKECPGSSLENCRKAAVGDLSRYYKENILNYLYHNTVVDVSGLREIEISYNSLDNLLQSNIPLAAGLDNSGNVIAGSSNKMLEDVIWTEDLANTPAYVLINSDATLQIPESYGAWPGQAIEEKNCALIVEPIFWIAIKTHESNDTEHTFNGKYYTKGYVYGTLWNLLNYPWKGGHGTYGELLSIVMCNSLANNKDYVVKSTGKTIKGVTPKQKYNPLSKAVDSMNDGYGLGLHVYDSEAFKKTTSSTSTYDEGLGNQIGASENCSNLPEETSYKTLSKKVSIIKSYETVKSDGSVINDGYFIRQNVPHTIRIEEEPEYKICQWESSTEQSLPYGLTESNNGGKNYTYEQLTSGSDKIQSGNSENNIVLLEQERILYVKLQKQETPVVQNNRQLGQYTLYESEISKSVQITPIEIEYTFPDISLAGASHGSHGYGSLLQGLDANNNPYSYYEHNCSGISHFSDGNITDKDVKLTIKNDTESSYSNIIVQSDKDKFKSDCTIKALSRATKSEEKKKENHTYYFTIYRNTNNEQNLTLSKYSQKQSSNQDTGKGNTATISSNNMNVIKTLGYNAANTKATKNRGETDYTIPVTFKFIYNPTNSPDISTTFTLHTKSSDCGQQIGGQSNTKSVTSNTEVIVNSDIAVQVYSGQSNQTLHQKLWTETIGKNGEHYLQIRDNKNKTVGRQIQSSQIVKFSPFIRMTYSTVDELRQGKQIKHSVNVLSEYQREINFVDYAEVAWQLDKNKNNISLLSNMWSTDEALSNGSKSWAKPNQVLKGGSSCVLQIADSDMQQVDLRTYQMVYPDDYISDYLINADSYTVSNATTEHDKFVQSCIDSFEQLHIVQRITTKITDDCISDERAVTRGSNISFLNNGSSTTSPDSKYYFNTDSNNGLNSSSSESDLDVMEGNKNILYYKIWSDTSGNIMIASNSNLDTLKNNISGEVILTKTQGINDLQHSMAKELNNRTFVVEKLINSVERNTGNDLSADWATDNGHWYNESAQVFVMIQTTPIKLGFKSPNTRATVIDPRLCPYISNKKDQGTEAYTSMYSTNDFSEKWGATEKGKIGEFKGKSIYMEDMSYLMHSKNFFIPNMTTQGSR